MATLAVDTLTGGALPLVEQPWVSTRQSVAAKVRRIPKLLNEQTEDISALYLLEQNLRKEIASDNASSGGLGKVFNVCFVLSIPVVVGVIPVGFSLAQSRSDIGPPKYLARTAPLIVSSFLSGLAMLTKIWFQHGVGAVRELARRKYLKVCLSGWCGTMRFFCDLVALALVSPTLAAVLMKTTMVYGLILQALLLRNVPSLPHVMAVVTLVGIATSFTLIGGDTVGQGGHMAGVAVALASPLFNALSDYSMELFIKLNSVGPNVIPGEAERCAVWWNFANMVGFLPLLLTYDLSFVLEFGFFGGWTRTMWLGFVLPQVARNMLFPMAIALCGALLTNLAGCMDVIVTHAAQVAFLHGKFTSTKLFLLLTLASSGANFVLLSVEAKAAVRNKQREFLLVLQETMQCLRGSDFGYAEFRRTRQRSKERSSQVQHASELASVAAPRHSEFYPLPVLLNADVTRE